MPYPLSGRTKKWMGQVPKQGGGYKRKSFLTKKEAITWEVDHQNQKDKKPVTSTEKMSLTCLQWATEYLTFAQAKYVTKTFKEKRAVFKKLFRAIDPNMPIEGLTMDIFLQYILNQKKTRSGNAINSDRKNLIAAYNWGIKYKGFPRQNPCVVDRLPEIRVKRYMPPIGDFWKVYAVAESEQDQLILLAILHTGGRKSEILNLRWQDINFTDAEITLHTRKRECGSLEGDELPMTDDLYNGLLVHKQHSESEYVFPNPKTGIPYADRHNWMHRLCGLAGVKYFGIHGLRHLTASVLADAAIPTTTIQKILRHKNSRTTEKYLHSLRKAKPALELLSNKKLTKPVSTHNPQRPTLKIVNSN